MLKNNQEFLELCKKLVLNNSTKIVLKESEELILMAKLNLIGNMEMKDSQIAKLYYDLGYSNMMVNSFEINRIYNNCLEKINDVINRYGVEALEKIIQTEELKNRIQGTLSRKEILEIIINNNIKISFNSAFDLLEEHQKLELPIESLDLQSYEKLKRAKINSVYDLINYPDISKIKGLDVAGYLEIIEKLYGLGLLCNEEQEKNKEGNKK